MTAHESLGRVIASRRISHGLSVQDVAERAGLDESLVSAVEAGVACLVAAGFLEISTALNADPVDLILRTSRGCTSG